MKKNGNRRNYSRKRRDNQSCRSVNKGTSTGINRPIVKMYSLENCELRHNENAGKHRCK